MSRKGTKMSCDGLALGKNNFWIHSKSSFTSPATFFECYDGTGTKMGRRCFQQWVGCNFGTLKKSCDFSSFNTFPPNLEVYDSIRTVLHFMLQMHATQRKTSILNNNHPTKNNTMVETVAATAAWLWRISQPYPREPLRKG